MNLTDAFKVFAFQLGIKPSIEEIKSRYKELCKKYHPDLGGSEEMMKILNDAKDSFDRFEWESFKSFEGGSKFDLGEFLNNLINQIFEKTKDVDIEICGTWLWLHGQTYQNRVALKELGCRFSKGKGLWYWRQDGYVKRHKKIYKMDEIRNSFGSEFVYGEKKVALA